MTFKGRLFIIGVAAASALTITYLMVGCNYDASSAGVQPPVGVTGESPIFTPTPAVIAVSPISGTIIVTAETPINYGPFRIIPSNHPESEIFYRKSTPDPQRTSTQINTITDARKIVPRFKEPTFLPEGLALAAVEGVLASDGSYYVIAAYRSKGQEITILQMPVRQTPIPVLKSATSPVQDMQLSQVDGKPAIVLVPKKGLPATNPKSLQWVQGGVSLKLDASGWPDMDTLMRVASSMK